MTEKKFLTILTLVSNINNFSSKKIMVAKVYKFGWWLSALLLYSDLFEYNNNILDYNIPISISIVECAVFEYDSNYDLKTVMPDKIKHLLTYL